MTTLDPTRVERLTGSDLPVLMSGNENKILNLWFRILGDSRYEAENFNNTWEAEYGEIVEPLAVKHFEKDCGEKLLHRQQQFFHPLRKYVSVTLDGYRASDDCVIDVKCLNAFWTHDEAVNHYAAQLVAQQECKGAAKTALLVVRGGTRPVEVPFNVEPAFREQVWRMVDRFWLHVETLTPPFPIEFKKIVPREQWKTYDLDDPYMRDANWIEELKDLLSVWGMTDDIATVHERVRKEIKSLLPIDCGKLYYSEFAITRAKNGAVTIKRKNDHDAERATETRAMDTASQVG